jgi:hypothetical protein
MISRAIAHSFEESNDIPHFERPEVCPSDIATLLHYILLLKQNLFLLVFVSRLSRSSTAPDGSVILILLRPSTTGPDFSGPEAFFACAIFLSGCLMAWILYFFEHQGTFVFHRVCLSLVSLETLKTSLKIWLFPRRHECQPSL